jgi:hypothetical protein
VDGSDSSSDGGRPSGPSPAQAAAAAAARQAVAYRLLGAACALVGVLLVVGGLLALRGRPSSPAPAASAPASSSAGRTTTPPVTTAPTGTAAPATTPPTTTATPPPTTAPPTRSTTVPARSTPPARAPLTVLNNTTRAHLAEQAAATFGTGGWQVVKVGNFTGNIPVTTVYFTPGSAAEEQAARALAAQYPGIGRVLARYAGLPPSVHGVIVVLAPDWPG